MATALASVDSRPTCRCDHCGLVQFVPRAGLSAPCRRCHVALDFVPEPLAPVPVPASARFVSLAARLAITIKTFRLERGLSQRQLAIRIPVPRTYISKLENENAVPTLASLGRVAQGLDVTVAELLSGGERVRRDEIGELMRDPFVAAISAFLPRLSVAQRANALAETRDLAERRRAAAGPSPRSGHGQVPFVVGAVAGVAGAATTGQTSQ